MTVIKIDPLKTDEDMAKGLTRLGQTGKVFNYARGMAGVHFDTSIAGSREMWFLRKELEVVDAEAQPG